MKQQIICTVQIFHTRGIFVGGGIFLCNTVLYKYSTTGLWSLKECAPPYTDPVTYITKCLINVCALACTLSRKVSEYPQKTEPVTFRAVKTVCVKKIEYMYVSCVQMPDMYIVHNTYILFRPDRLVYMRIFRFFLGQCILRNNLSRLCWKNMAPGPGNSSNISRKIESQENFGEQDPDEQFSKSLSLQFYFKFSISFSSASWLFLSLFKFM